MPIEHLSDVRRLSRDFKIRLGGRMIKVQGAPAREAKPKEEGGYPSEADFFVMLPDEVPDDVRDLYGAEPRSLRMMLPMEWDAVDPHTSDEYVFNRYNRAYGRTHGLKCKGTGNSAEYPGMATTSDEPWSVRIAAASGMAREKVELHGAEMYQVRCLGTDCPKYLRTVEEEYTDSNNVTRRRTVKAQGVDADAACKRVFLLRAFLIHPTVDTTSPDYCRVMGLAEIASSSYNTMVNLQSDFAMLRAFTGAETAFIPFRLQRVPITTYKPTRATHHVLKCSFDMREVSRWATVPLAERFQSEEMRARLRAIQASPLALTYDAVKDLIPQPLLEAPPEGQGGTRVQTPTGGGETVPGGAGEAQGTLGEESPGDRKLLKGELDELKGLAGAGADQPEPKRIEGLSRLKEVVTLFNAKHGTSVATDADGRVRFTDLTYDIYVFVKEYLTGEGVG